MPLPYETMGDPSLRELMKGGGRQVAAPAAGRTDLIRLIRRFVELAKDCGAEGAFVL